MRLYQVTVFSLPGLICMHIFFLFSDYDCCQYRYLNKMLRASAMLDDAKTLPEQWVQPYEKEASMFYHRSKLPSGIFVPTKTNDKLNHVHFNTNPPHYNSQQRQIEVRSKRYPLSSTISDVENSTTTPKPPMIWFPGGNNCNKEEANDSGKYKLYPKQVMAN